MTTGIWQLSESELLADAAAVSHQIQLLEARRIALVAEIDTRVTREQLGFPGPASWLTATTLLSAGKANKITALARGLTHFPDIADAVNAGTISLDHAALILTFAETPPKNLPDDARDIARRALLHAATGPGARTDRLRAAITHLKDTYSSDGPPADDTDRNELFVSKTLNGRLAMRGEFDAVTGEKIYNALSPLAAPHPAVDGTPDDRTPARRRADALGHIIDRYLATTDRPTEGGDRPHLNLHVRLDDLTDPGPAADRGAYRDLFGDGNTVGWLPWMGPLSRTTSRQLACDCILTAIVMDENGSPVNLGRTERTVTAKQKRALIARDHGCAFPGCGRPASWTEAHHIWHWIDGGPTDLDNLVLLCGFHHRLLHHSDWTVFIGTDRHPWFIPPATVDPYRQPRPSHARAGPHIT